MITNVYPNPVDDFATFNYSIEEYGKFEIKAYDILGRLIYQTEETAVEFTKQSFTIDTGNWAEGMYFITISNNKQPAKTPLVVIH